MPAPVPPSDEVERLRSVYRGYDEEPANRRRWSNTNQGNRAIADQRLRRARALLAADPQWRGRRSTVLDLGCGTGGVPGELFGDGADAPRVTGIDLSEERLRVAAERLAGVPLVRAEGSALPFVTGEFDLVLAFTVFSSVRDDVLARRMAAEIDRVLRPSGAVLWYDMRHPNPANPHTQAMSLRKVRSLFPRFTVALEPITVLPPLARRLGRATHVTYRVLERVRPLCSHHLGLLRKPA